MNKNSNMPEYEESLNPMIGEIQRINRMNFDT